jgi:hypothetical protein
MGSGLKRVVPPANKAMTKDKHTTADSLTEVKVRLSVITIRDENSGEAHRVKTLRSAREIAEYIEESEKEIIVDKLEDLVCELY